MAEASEALIERVRDHFRAHQGTARWEDLCQELDAPAGEVHAALSRLIESGEVELAGAEPPCNPSYRLTAP